ncbi:uncharacterized protein [Eurosta solidaginis]|uniref:uncharacterized protein isoform X1 n=1 Tax=Eurosta solidaginis TaxID=178769 RepID=UPI003530CDC1
MPMIKHLSRRLEPMCQRLQQRHRQGNWSSYNWSATPPTSIAGGVTYPYQQAGEQQKLQQQQQPQLGPMPRQSGLMQSQFGQTPPQHPMDQPFGGHEQHGSPGMPPASTGPGGAMITHPVMPRYIP